MAALRQDQTLRPMTVLQVRAHVARTLTRAHKLHWDEKVQRVRQGLYRVPSTSQDGVVYLVTGLAVPLACTCEANYHMPMCVHRAAVLLRRWAADGIPVWVDEAGRMSVDAADLAYPIRQWPALLDGAPPPEEAPDPDDGDRADDDAWLRLPEEDTEP